MIIERDLQPFESFVSLASHGVSLSDLIVQALSASGHEFGQSRVRRLAITAHVMCECELKTTKVIVWLELRFASGVNT